MITDNNSRKSTAPLDQLLNSKSTVTSRDLHKYIWTMIGVFFLFAGSLPLAWSKVAQSEKYNNQKFESQPLNSIEWSENQKANLVYPEKK